MITNDQNSNGTDSHNHFYILHDKPQYMIHYKKRHNGLCISRHNLSDIPVNNSPDSHYTL